MTPSTVIAKYKNMSFPEVGVATVRDFCDSWDNMRPLSEIAGDLKDVQRPWMVKAIVASVPIGGRLCEIGAGEPFVADFLNKCGYEVTVVDPYDGSGQGPIQFENYAASYPNIRFLRSNFGSTVTGLSDQYFDAIYSISVLEHIPTEQVMMVCDGIKRYCKSTGYSIHAIDHVLLGAGDAFHLDKLKLYADNLGISHRLMEQVLDASERDAETYFLSAAGHNLWRGAMNYESFPMRKVISVNIFRKRASG